MEKEVKNPFDNWDKSKTYISPSRDIIRIYLDGEWKAFYSQEETNRMIDAGIKAYQQLQTKAYKNENS